MHAQRERARRPRVLGLPRDRHRAACRPWGARALARARGIPSPGPSPKPSPSPSPSPKPSPSPSPNRNPNPSPNPNQAAKLGINGTQDFLRLFKGFDVNNDGSHDGPHPHPALTLTLTLSPTLTPTATLPLPLPLPLTGALSFEEFKLLAEAMRG